MIRPQRIVAPLLLSLLVLGVVFGIYISSKQQKTQRGLAAIVAVKGLVGSEKLNFLTDPRVLDILRKNGVDLHVETAGSREIAGRTDLKNYNFAFPAGAPAAKKLMQAAHVTKSFTPFFTPMTVASWKPIAEILIANGIVKRHNSYYYIINMPKLLKAIDEKKRWHDLAKSGAYDINKSLLISSTDVRKSNSAAMYLALASYLLNNNEVVQNQNQINRVLPQAGQLFLRQGYQESSSAGPFEDYTAMGMGKAPLVMIYEAQFIEFEVAHPQSRNPDMVLLYPQPTLFTKHTLVPFDPQGEKLGDLLQNDPELQHLAAEHGLRTSDSSYDRTFWKKNGIRLPDTLIDVVDPPSYEVLETMIRSIEQQLNNA